MKDVCHDVHVEPQLLPVTGEDLPPETCRADGARADISAVGLWQPLNKAFFELSERFGFLLTEMLEVGKDCYTGAGLTYVTQQVDYQLGRSSTVR